MVQVRNVVLQKDKGNLLALANITVENGLYAAEGLRIIKNKDGQPFVSMPSRKRMKAGVAVKDEAGKDTYQDLFHPTSKEARDVLSAAVLHAYNAAVEGAIAKKNAADPASK